MREREPYLVRYDLGGVRFSSAYPTVQSAREAIGRMDAPEGYSSHSATLYEWRTRVDGHPYLKLCDHWHFGKLVDRQTSTTASLSPLLDSDGPDYDPESYVAMVDA